MANLYCDESLSDAAFVVGATLEVCGDEAHHAVRVSRLRVGETTLLGNGAGVVAAGVVTSVSKQSFALRVTEVRRHERAEVRLVLAQALAKGDRDERAIEQATEFGVDEIVPWEAERSVSRWRGDHSGRARGEAVLGERAQKGVLKWRRITREAAKQSLRGWIPTVSAPASIDELCQRAAEPETLLVVLHPRATEHLSRLRDLAEPHTLREVVCVIGPEGGLSDAELEQFQAAGAQSCLLGETVLRTSSAGPAALAVLNVLLQRW